MIAMPRVYSINEVETQAATQPAWHFNLSFLHVDLFACRHLSVSPLHTITTKSHVIVPVCHLAPKLFVRQTITPDELRGRTNAVYRLVVTGVVVIGALLGGVLSERVSLNFTLLVGAIDVSCSWLWLLCSPAFQLRRLSEGAEK